MNKIILAATLAISSVIAIPAASYAETVTIRTDDGMHRPHRGPHARMAPRKHCMSKKVVTYRHGEKVTRVTRVCR
ncbi:hypothetical protein [Rhizobium oryzicola]|uniref:Uncharacterized protein n=1 Tax=Rhizobium oryzicola TaxID=1232668 RepID=A0ABT8SS72_9HYPH|nr:hypothetical protein [Rhizobium oryzicola]MDO1581259.1 hypothetical protein [Rhizobium oryzicola]